jgi:hypothetical protein
MKKIIFTCAFVMFAFIAQAQENKFAGKRSANAVEYISSNMDLSEANVEFLKETLYNKYANNASKIRGKDLSQDEKKQVYRTAFIETRKKLMTVFSKEQVGKITKLERESHKK